MDKWTDIEARYEAEKRAYFSKLAAAKITKREALKISGIDRGRLDYMLEVMGIEWVFPEQRPACTDEEMRDRRQAFFNEGFSEKYIAQIEGITAKSLRSYCNKNGIKRRICA